MLIFLMIIPLQLTPVQQFLSIPNQVTSFSFDDDQAFPPISNTTPSITELSTKDQMAETEVFYHVGNFPVKKVDVTVSNNHEVIPGGQSIGVQLQTKGVLVVGHHLVNKVNQTDSPAENANIKIGDLIVKMDGKQIKQLEDLKEIVQKAGEEKEKISITLKRGNEIINTKVEPTYNKQDDSYQIGVYIRDATTGIGTVSFYDRKTGKYGALGHVISDADTKKPIEIHQGKIVYSSVTHIEKGNRGMPGEKQAKFSLKDQALGTIDKNTPFGIFGTIDPKLIKEKQEPIPIGLANEVEKGPAEILTVVEGDKIEKFSIEIVNSLPQSHPSTKGMIIKVTDKKLLEKTGGIVQGMSGSPIIQNGKLVGAVTHVFVNDPTSGYGVHIEWMLKEAELNLFDEKDKEVNHYVEAL